MRRDLAPESDEMEALLRAGKNASNELHVNVVSLPKHLDDVFFFIIFH